MLRRGRVLDQDQAAAGLDLADAQRPVGTAAGEHHGHGLLLPVLGQRAEEGVDGGGQGRRARFQPHAPLVEQQVLARRDDVDVIRLDRLVLRRLQSRRSRSGRPTVREACWGCPGRGASPPRRRCRSWAAWPRRTPSARPFPRRRPPGRQLPPRLRSRSRLVRAWETGIRDWGLGIRTWVLGLRSWVLGLRILGLGV